MQQNTAEQLAHFPLSALALIKFRQPMAEKTVGLLFITRRRLSYANDAEDPETLTAGI